MSFGNLDSMAEWPPKLPFLVCPDLGNEEVCVHVRIPGDPDTIEAVVVGGWS